MDLLASLTEEQLHFKPSGEKWQPLYYQFGCMARTQLVYADAVLTGRMDFSLFNSDELPSKDGAKNANVLKALLGSSNEVWLNNLVTGEPTVRWPDGNKSLELHIASLAEHERLHHGQLISYFTLANIDLPSGFKNNWSL
jgi:hypothetical protein